MRSGCREVRALAQALPFHLRALKPEEGLKEETGLIRTITWYLSLDSARRREEDCVLVWRGKGFRQGGVAGD